MHAIAVTLTLVVACASPAGDRLGGSATDSTRVVCSNERRVAPLPHGLKESSGLAISSRDPDLLWTLEDSGAPPELVALDTLGVIRARVRVRGARNVDWEDLAAGWCPGGSACLYIADTGNNDGDRREVTVYRIPEPAASDTGSRPATAFTVRYPDGPHDTEALAVAVSGALYLVTKGSLGRPRYVFLVAQPSVEGVNVPRPLARLGGARPLVTGAAMSPDGRYLGIRTYRALRFFRVARPDSLLPVGADAGIPLDRLREPQGEAVAIRADGIVFLSSEARNGRPAQLSRMVCTFPR